MSFQFGNTISVAWKKLKAGDYTVRSFEANKLWKINTDTNDQYYYDNIGTKVYRALYAENHKYFGKVANLSSSLYERVFPSQSLDPKLLWYHLDHTYYTEYENGKVPVFITEDATLTYLWQSSSIVVFPMDIFGEGIKKKSFTMTNYSSTSSKQFTVTDDGLGNLIDTSFDTGSFIPIENNSLYIGFNEKYREFNYKNEKLDYVLDTSPRRHNVRIINPKKISYQNGIPTSDTLEPTGVSANIDGAYFQVNDAHEFNFTRINNFAFSFWIKVPPTQSMLSSNYNAIFNKNTVERIDRNGVTSVIGSPTEQYPFDISLLNASSSSPNSIRFRQSSELETAFVTSSALTPNNWHHVVCQKTGSNYQIWLNGSLNASTNAIISNKILNNHNFYIGDNGTGTKYLSGSLDEIRIYRTGLTSNQINGLYDNGYETGSAYQTNRVGNVFYKRGIAVVSDPRPKYANAFLGKTGNFDYNTLNDGFSGQFRSTTTMYEHEIVCKIRKHEFNYTQNPSILRDVQSGPSLLDTYVTNPYFNPYITTIGLYNKDKELVAVAKLANPLEKRDDVDMNIIIRFDM
jgi:hypothetical protein